MGVEAGSIKTIMGVPINVYLDDADIDRLVASGSVALTGTVIASYPSGGDVDFTHSMGSLGVIVQTYDSTTNNPAILPFTRYSDKITFHFPAIMYEETFKVVIVG